MNEQDRRELREFYCKEYQLKTGVRLECIEQTGVRPCRCKVACRMNILQIASEYSGIPVEAIVSRSRKSELADIRRMIAGVMRIHQISMTEIGALFNMNDHSNVSIMMGVHRDYCKVDKEYREKYNEFKDYCKKEILRIHQEGVHSKTKITRQMIEQIQQKRQQGGTTVDTLAQEYNIHRNTVSKIVNNRYKKKSL